jgi:hypothetical protein
METKDNIFKLIIRIILIGFVLFSMYVVVFPPKYESFLTVMAYALGGLTWLGLATIGIFSFAALCTFLVTRLLGWVFNTDYFD